MSKARVDMHRLQELLRLHRLGNGSREVCRLLKMGPNTERDYRQVLEPLGLLQGSPTELPELEYLQGIIRAARPQKETAQTISSVEPWRTEIEKQQKQGAGPHAIFDTLRLNDQDFPGSLAAIRRLCKAIRREQGVSAEDVAIPVETPPGEIAQVDFGYLGKVYDPETGTRRKVWVFVLVLGYSRHLFARLVFNQKVETWIALHEAAFAELQGVVVTVVPDNLKAAVVRTAFGVDGPTELNRSYRELARHYNFQIDPTPPYDPEKKGKVESGVKYVKRNFYATRKDLDYPALVRELPRWIDVIAGTRDHGTTHRPPLAVFRAEEQATLKPLPERRYDPVIWKRAKVHRDTHAAYGPRLYSVPWRLIGKTVWIHATATTVAIYYDDVRVATHRPTDPGPRSTDPSHLPEVRGEFRQRQRSYWEAEADRIDPAVGEYIREVFDSDDVLSKLRTVQSLVAHLRTFPVARAVAACRRAQYYGNYTYHGVKDILRQALDRQPLPTAVVPTGGGLTRPVFARRAADLLQLPLEVSHEPQ
ncbi:MAG: IS21 family transposase [Myxococcota bacterium]|nr:IS21 family transposase [Myxococcota bacterium]